jgi:superfamily II DNA or RNA helicase
MKLSPEIDLSRSLRQVFGNKKEFNAQIEADCERQSATANDILGRFFGARDRERREMMLLADEVGLGKTYVALAVAVSMLDAIRRGDTPEGLPSNKPVVLVLTPTNDALFNKWVREAETFKKDCARKDGGLDWLQIRCPLENGSKSGNLLHLSAQLREATRSRPVLLIAKHGVLGAALHDRDLWRRRGLAALFGHFRTPRDTRRYWCRKGKVFDNFGIPELNELLDLRSSGPMWADPISPDLERAYAWALALEPRLAERCAEALSGTDEDLLSRLLDDLTRCALAADWPQFPLVVIDEVHGFKNRKVQARLNFEAFTTGRICRLLGLSATPFQLRHDELLSVLALRSVLSLPADRVEALDESVAALERSMKAARDSGETFRKRWKALRPSDQTGVGEAWDAVSKADEAEQAALAAQTRPPRVAHAIAAALDLERRNAELKRHLHPFVIRHQHARGYREHFVGRLAAHSDLSGSRSFSWSPGIEVRGNDELAQYAMMRAVALAKEERGLPGLGAELTGSYRHLVETAAVWRKLAESDNPNLRAYRAVLEDMIGKRSSERDPDAEHCKVQATVRRALEFFKRGQKSLIFCVYTKTAETIRDQLEAAIEAHLSQKRQEVFGDASAFENFRRRFFNRREPLYSLIQDHPLLGEIRGGRVGVAHHVALGVDHLRQIAALLVERGEDADSDKPDRRLLLAATEHVAVNSWRGSPEGEIWLGRVLQNCQALANKMADPAWLEAREPLSRSERAGRVRRTVDPEADESTADPLDAEDFDETIEPGRSDDSTETSEDRWVRRLREDAIGGIVAPYFRHGLIAAGSHLPLLATHHGELLAKFDLSTRAVAGQVFRRILMAEEFLLRYLTDVEKEQAERWADYLSERYVRPLDGHLESLRDRVHTYFETLFRAEKNSALLAGYHAGAENRNVVQLVKGDTQNRDRYYLGFNTPYRPEILVSTSVGQEGIDLHRECRHVIHHDLCWNPATIEQRTGRVDRIGSKVERERMGAEDGEGPTLEIAVPYLAATYDERMFEELYRRAQLFEVTLGGEIRVEGRIDPEHVDADHRRRKALGIGTDDEDIGEESSETGVVDLPADMIERLRVDLSVWKLRAGSRASPNESLLGRVGGEQVCGTPGTA